jgi:transposase InsO family protein
MTNKNLNDIALFRFSLIAPVVNDTFDAISQMEYFRNISAKTHTLPDGSSVKFSAGAIKKWFLTYRKEGFEALVPKTRRDLGKPRNLDLNAMNQIHALKEKFPYITGKLIYHKLVEEGYIKVNKTSLATVQRYIRDNNLKRTQIVPVDRRAFEMQFANDCWQSDTSHGPVIKVNNQKRQTYLIIFIDDASRMVLHGEFFFNDNAINMQVVFKKAISKYGVPKKLFVDNGGSYKNDQLQLICASLGTVLIHTKPYSPESKGKVERMFRTIKDNWLNAVDWNDFKSLEQMNEDFAKYLNEKYTNEVHSALETTPRQRFLDDSTKFKFIPSEILETHFLHRDTRKVNNDATIKLNNIFFEVPQKYIGQRINIRYLPNDTKEIFVFSKDNKLTETVYPLKRIDNSKIRRNSIDYSKMNGGDSNV